MITAVAKQKPNKREQEKVRDKCDIRIYMLEKEKNNIYSWK